jgi:type 2 lantibiotic biosynthesis protein LanM
LKQIESMSERDLVEIIERASTIDERLGDDFVPAESGDAALAERRLEAWSQALGNGDWDRLRRRLAWDGLDPESVRPALGPVCLREGVPLPEWSKLLAEALRLAPTERQEDEAWPTEMGFLDAEDALPFEEVLAPFVLVARERLARRTVASGTLLSAAARAALERSLLRNLSSVSGELLLTEFETMRGREQSSWDRLFALAQEPEGRSLYRQFVRRLGEGGIARLLRQYPVLARQLGTISQLWVEASVEFLGRLEADMPELERLFSDDEESGNVVELEPSLSDPHRGGRSVIALTFASGRKLVYKPKDMGTEAAYHRLLAWLNELGAPLPFKVLKVLDRSTYGWVEFVEHLSCRDQDEARRYYERAGMLLCLFYALEGTDCHYENIIASGEYPVLIDTETLMHHRARAAVPEAENAQTEAFERMGHSVLRSGLLPRWELSADRRTAYHISGLGEADEQELPVRAPRWVRINTDRMALEFAFAKLRARGNVPTLDDVPLSLQEHSPQVVEGFRRMYRFLLDHRDALLGADPLRELAGEQVRFVFRATRVYGLILRKVRHRRYLRDGADRSIQLEQLGLAQVPPRDAVDEPDEKPFFWPVFAAERLAMEGGDIPFFTARASSDALILPAGQEIDRCFQEPSFDLVLSVLEGLDDEDLEQQVAFIEGSMYAHLARVITTSQPDTDPEEDLSAGPPSEEAFVAPALEVAEVIRSCAIRTEDGSAAWIAPQYLVQAERYQLQPMDYDLYGGTSGVALFLAAAERFAPGSGYGELALAALRPLQSTLDRHPDRLAGVLGIGGASGLGSVAYSLLHVSRLLDEPALLEDARRVTNLITEDVIASDRALDVIGGAAGAILSLLALYEVRPNRRILEPAIACGGHLLEARTATDAGLRAWVTDEGLRTTGFAHGTAGIAYSLLRLYGHTRDPRFLEAAKEAIAHEDTQYSPENHNWVGFKEPGEPAYQWQWCHGAPGIGLARVGGLGVLDTGQVREDIDLAVQTTLDFGVQGVDHPCCGNMGRAELLLSAGQRLARPELEEAARANAWRVVSRAERTGGFVLHPMLPRQVDNPGFFQGTAGIGYELLRMARPDLLPSVLLWESASSSPSPNHR